MVHICGICAHPRSFFWSIKMYWDHFVDGLLLVNMFIIITKMHLVWGLFCKHVYHHFKNVPYRIRIVSIVCWCCRSTVPPPTSAFTVYKTQILRRNICPSLKSASVSTHRMKNQSILISLLPHVSALSNIILYLLYIIII